MKQRSIVILALCLAFLGSVGVSSALADDPFKGCSTAAHRTGKKLALTFDDGYDSAKVNHLLDILDREYVHATFFPVGAWADQDPATIARMRRRHEVGNHTVTHPTLTQLSDEAIRREITGGVPSRLFRPPYGTVDARVKGIVESMGLRVVLWDIDTNDWAGVSTAQLTSEVVNGAGDGKIVLMHMASTNTHEALPRIIETLRAKGFNFVTVSELGNDRKVSSTFKRWACELDLKAGRLKIYVRQNPLKKAVEKPS